MIRERVERPAWVADILGDSAAILDATAQSVIFELDRLEGWLSEAGLRRVLLVFDRGAVTAAGVDVARIFGSLDVTPFENFTPNPTSQQAENAARLAIQRRADVVVGLGGGSCGDVAKVAAIAAAAPDKVRAITRGRTASGIQPLPLALIPTTSGTGCEATHFAVIYVDGRKVSVGHPEARPAVCVLDERLHHAMPEAIAAATGLDALCQACESTWAVGATDESLRYAEAAGPLLAHALRPSVMDRSRDARRAMLLGSHLAGRAINISKTTASHAMSYQLTQRFGIAHGHAVALTLGHIASVSARVSEEDALLQGGARVVRDRVTRAAGYLGATPAEMGACVAELLADLGLARSLRDAGVPREALREIATRVDPVRLGNNPARLSEDTIVTVLERAWDVGATVDVPWSRLSTRASVHAGSSAPSSDDGVSRP